MKPIAMKPAWAVMLLAAALMGGAHARSQPTDTGDTQGSSKAKKKSAKAGHSGQIKFLPGSGETTKERSTRRRQTRQPPFREWQCAPQRA